MTDSPATTSSCRRARFFAVACLTWAHTFGCSTTYQPRQPGRVGLIAHHAALLYVKDGRELPIGPFSGELEQLVADTPNAAIHARTAHTQLMVGVPAYLLGVAGIMVGILALSGPAGWVVIGAGASAAGTGLGFMGAGVTHLMDAINFHNENLHPVNVAQAQR